MKKEKYINTTTSSEVSILENEIVSFNKYDKTETSFRVYKDGFVGVYYQQGKMSDKEGFEKAEANLELKRQYPFELEGGVRELDKTKKLLSDEELMKKVRSELSYLRKAHPDFTFSGKFITNSFSVQQKNSAGMNYKVHDGFNGAFICFKHKDSKDLDDGNFGMNLRNGFSSKKFRAIADNYLSNFTKMQKLPEELIIMMPEWELNGKLVNSLNAEKLALGTSLLSGKIGEKVFSEELTVYHDVSPKNIWMTTFWDADGIVHKGDKLCYIKKGRILRGYADKRIAAKYKVECTGSAYMDYGDIPGNGWVNFRITPLKKTPKEILNGRLSVLPVQFSGGGFNDAGEYAMPVQMAYLTDGEKILGRLPPFTMRSNMFDIFGKDFIGVSKSTDIWNKSMMLVKMEAGKL